MFNKNKIIYKIIVCLLTIIGISFYVDNGVSANNDIVKEHKYQVPYKVLDVKDYDDLIVIYTSNNSYILYQENLYEINYYINDVARKDDIFYILSTNKMFVYSITKKEIKELISIDEANIKSFEIVNNIIYFVGNKSNDSCIYLYYLNGSFINFYTYGGGGFEEFIDLKYYDNSLYVVGIIDANSSNSPFKNTGNNGRSVCIVKFKNNILNGFDNTIYLKNNINITVDKVLFSDTIGLLINKEFYSIDYDLKINTYMSNSDKYEDLIDSTEGIKAYNILSDKVLFNDDYQYYYKTNISYLGYINDNFISIYYNEFDVIINEIFTYNILYNDEITLSYYYNNYDIDDYFKIRSPFNEYKLSIDKDSYDKTFKKSMPGTYKFNYVIESKTHKEYVEGSIKVLEYVNIIDGGVYQTNKELIYFGDAILDGKSIYNGYKVNIEGTHSLEITSYNGKKIYNFVCVNEYYKDDDSVSFDSDYYIHTNDSINVLLSFETNLDIQEVILNGKEYNEFEVKLNQLFITIHSKNEYSIDRYILNSVLYLSNNELIELRINDEFYVTTLKDNPSVSLYESLNNNLISLSYTIIDPCKTIFYILREFYYNNDLLFTQKDYLAGRVNDVNTLNYENLVEIEYLVFYNGNELIKFMISDTKIEFISNKNYEKSEHNVTNLINSYTKYYDLENAKFEYIRVNNENTIENLKVINKNIDTILIIKISISIVLFTICFITIRHFVIKRVKKK